MLVCFLEKTKHKKTKQKPQIKKDDKNKISGKQKGGLFEGVQRQQCLSVTQEECKASSPAVSGELNYGQVKRICFG